MQDTTKDTTDVARQLLSGPRPANGHAPIDPSQIALLDAWAAEITTRAKAAAWDEGFNRGFYDSLAGADRDASESAAVNPYEAQCP